MEAATGNSRREAELSTRPVAKLALQDGSSYDGFSFGSDKPISGECVFQTGMVGYVESLTDPSYRGQILVLSYPLIGNYGVPSHEKSASEGLGADSDALPVHMESDRIQAAGLVICDYSGSESYSHWNAIQSLGSWLRSQGVPGICGIDTRALIKRLRDTGSMPAKILPGSADANALSFVDPNQTNLVALVSTPKVLNFNPANVSSSNVKTVLMLDCGMKSNQVRCLLRRGVRVRAVPFDHPLADEDRNSYDGIFLSNGPGDPAMLTSTVANIRAVLEREKAQAQPKPIFGICLGNQLLGLSAGASTFKLKFGNRGQNQPCVDLTTGRCHLTMQNHGYAIDTQTLPADWQPYFVNANDATNEGIRHSKLPWFSVQFHPEAKGGPTETEYLFDKFIALVKGEAFSHPLDQAYPHAPKSRPAVSKVILLGSGGLSIGQAGEFDYSGSQAIKALKEEGVKTILINPNIATVQTSAGLADKVYFVPVTPAYVTKVIEEERPDGILLQFGGQTALNCGIELYRSKTLERYGVAVLGTSVETIIATEDREVFSDRLKEINERIAPSIAARTVEAALTAAKSIGFPVIIRAGFALGGLGSGFASDEAELEKLASSAFASCEQILVEKSLKGWKEVEYEVVRDSFDNCITVCNMENFDPLGIHTGESIVVAPSQTLSDTDYHLLRKVALTVVRHLGVIGECNIQFAFDPHSETYFIIEVNARLSRSSALASKATGYPLAFVAAKLAMGHNLQELRNAVTKSTTACWEPSLDYVVVKMPRWDLKKFSRVSKTISTSMKSVGEVMAIGRVFEEAIQKAIRMVHPSRANGFHSYILDECEALRSKPEEFKAWIDHHLVNVSDERIFVLAEAFEAGYTVDKIHELTKIDRWFLSKLQHIFQYEQLLHSKATQDEELDLPTLRKAKQIGFSDKHIAKAANTTESAVRARRISFGIVPFVKQIDTVAAEFPLASDVNYTYMTYNGSEDDNTAGFNGEKSIVVLGSGSYSIGSSVEFDWCAVSCIRSASALGYKTIMINYNPETVSTDYDECDRLYFEELSVERVLDVVDRESPLGIVVSMGGQIPNNIAMGLSRAGVKILGTSADMIENAENRYKFSRMLDSIGIDQPAWKECKSIEETKSFCDKVGFPCLVRPSFVLSGAGMNVVHTHWELESFLETAQSLNRDSPVVITKFISNAKEIDVDSIAQNGVIIASAISEHVENAGVHSGDATLLLPAQDLAPSTLAKISVAVQQIAQILNVSGPFNVQFIAKDDEIKVIECNLRASRSLPFVSKTLLVDFAELATKALLGVPLTPFHIDLTKIHHVGTKVPQFSFTRLQGADPVLGVEMASTGEVACFGRNKSEAYAKALLATGFKWPKNKNVLLSIGNYAEKMEFLPQAQALISHGFTLFGTPGTSDFLSEHGIPTTTLQWAGETDRDETSVHAALSGSNKIDLCIMLPSSNRYRRPSSFLSNGYQSRRLAIDFSVPLVTNIKCAKLLIDALCTLDRPDSVEGIRLTALDVRGSGSRNVVKLPGLFDVHVHLREPGGEHKEDWTSGTAAALAGGFTFVGAMPNTSPSIVDPASFAKVSALAEAKAHCDYGIYMGASVTNAAEIAQFARPNPSSPVFALKMYLDQTFSTLKLDSLGSWMDHFANWPKDIPMCLHSEGSRAAACILLAHLYDRHVHVCHVSLKEEIEMIKQAKAKGIRVTCEVCPHHLFLTADDAPRLAAKFCPSNDPTSTTFRGGFHEVRPRLNTKADQDALWANIDVIDIIATDHAPHTVEEKSRDENAPPGFPGLETVFPLMLTAVAQKKLSLESLIEKMHTNPRRIFNLPEQPETWIEVDLDEKWVIPDHMEYTKSRWTPFAGMTVQGKVRKVVLRGETVMTDGRVVGKPGFGKNLAAQRTFGKVAPTPVELIAPIVAAPIAVSPAVAAVASSSAAVLATPSPALVSSPAKLAAAGATPVPLPVLPSHGPIDSFRSGNSVLSTKQFTRADLHRIFAVASDMKSMVKRMGSVDLLKGKVMANAFFEPSTRTSGSFYAAMTRLGGSVLPFEQSTSSVTKGESLEDTAKTLSSYADILVVRHPEKGAVQRAATASRVPVINAGDGIGEHPTQALLDVFSVREELGTVNGLNFTIIGDLKHGRTVHSLVQLIALYKNITITYVSPESLRMPQEVQEQVKSISVAAGGSIAQSEATTLTPEILKETDVLYVTRIQKERFATPEAYAAVAGSYKITPHTLTHCKDTVTVMHPLPRVDEIDPSLDSDPRAAYFRQTENGLYVRMALLAMILGKIE